MEMNKIDSKIVKREETEMNESAAAVISDQEVDETVCSVGCEVGIDSLTQRYNTEEMSPQLESLLETIVEQVKEEAITKIVKPFELSESRGSTRVTHQKGVFSVVNSLKGAKRISISNEVHDKIGAPVSVQVAFRDEDIILSKQLSPNKKESGYFILKPQGKSQMCYCTELVREISRRFNLDFSNRVSITFYDVEYETIEKNLAAIIKIA